MFGRARGWAAQVLQPWIQPWIREDPYRRINNHRSFLADRMGLQFLALCVPLVLFTKVWWRDGRRDLVLAHLPSALAAQSLVLLITARPAFYVRYREVLLVAFWLAFNATIISLNLQVFRQWQHHAGSPVLLLLLLLLSHPALCLFISALLGRILVRVNYAILLLFACQTLLSNGRMCERVLEADGIEEPLAVLYGGLVVMHSPVIFPSGQLSMSGTSPTGQCMAVMTWMMLAVGMLAPLCILAPLELRGRRRALAAAAPRLPPAELQRQQREHDCQVALLLQPSVRNAYLASCLLWAVAAACGVASL